MYAKALSVSMCSPISTKFSPSAHFVAPCTQSKNLVGSSEVKYGYFKSIKMASRSPKSSGNGRRSVLVNVMGEGSQRDNDNDDGFYIRRCVELARKAVGFTSPNPMVGCVIVKDGRIVGEGYHPRAGQPHAEVFALRDAGSMAQDATAYVSLEPCNHYGRTPPCTDALIKAKVRKVVVGMVDPNPIVASKGLDRLRDAGIDVTVGVEEQLCQKLNEAFTHRMLTGKPFVILRYSISLDGHLLGEVGKGATESGGYYSKLLQENDAVMHFSTMLGENPHLVLPSREPGANQPLHIFLAASPDLPNNLLPSSAEASQKVIVFTEKVGVRDSDHQREAELVALDSMSFASILEHCERRGISSVVVDVRGNASEFDRILREGFEQNLFQKVVVEVLPVWGGAHRLKSLGQSLKVKNLTSVVSGNGVLLEGYF